MKSRAAILIEQNTPLVIEEIEIPALKYGQVLVKILCSGICGSQIGEITGAKGPDRFLPHLLGHEGTAEVLEYGEGVSHVKSGDRVALHWRPGLGVTGIPPKYQSVLGVINAGWITTFNEYAIISENRMTPIPSDFSIDFGALMGCAITTGFGVINNNAQVKIGESVLVFGAGGVGLNVIQAAHMVSAYPIIAVDLYDNKLQLAQKLGATHIINSNTQSVEQIVFDIVGHTGVDVAIDNTGNVKVIESAYALTSSKGRTILVGVPRKGNKVCLYTLPLHFSKILTGSHGGESHPDQDIPRYIRLVEQSKLDLSPLIAAHYPLDEINTAINDMKNGLIAGRCIIDM